MSSAEGTPLQNLMNFSIDGQIVYTKVKHLRKTIEKQLKRKTNLSFNQTLKHCIQSDYNYIDL